MRIQTEYMCFKNCWMISSRYDFQAHQQCSQRRCRFPSLLYSDSRCSQAHPRCSQSCHRRSQTCCWRTHACHRHCQACHRHSQTCCWRSHVLPGAPKVLLGAPRFSQTYPNHSHGTPIAVISDSSYSEGRAESPPMVWSSPAIEASKFTLHILSDTPGGFQWLKYILLM